MSKQCAEYCDGISRRTVLQAGLGGVAGLTASQLLQLQAQSAEARGTSVPGTAVIFLELAGGPTQHETYDPKPAAPSEYRGPLNAIATSVPGISFSQYMAEQARILDKLAIVRSIHHDSGSHGTSSHLAQTGYYLRDRQNRDNEMPCAGSITARVRGANAEGLPAFVSIPRTMRYGRAAWLGKGYNPFETVKDPSRKGFEVPNLSLIGGLTEDRLQDRRKLISGLEHSRQIVDNHGISDALDEFSRQAFDMVTGDAARDAFDLDLERQETREFYGRNTSGQSLLLARRLVEAGVTFVTVRPARSSWDDHNGIAKRMKDKGPDYDRGVAALVSDLYERGLSERVLVVAIGEFGRTPRVNRNAGRDHWGRLMSVLFAGGGLQMGQVVGSSDKTGSAPKDRPYRPENVLAMVYRHLGIDASLTFPDHAGRPRYILEKRGLISELI
jgi:hypothetical protein